MPREPPTIDRETVSRNLMEPLMAVDADGDIAFANERFLTITRLSREEVLGADYTLLSTIVEDGFDEVGEAVEAIASGDSTEERVELAIRHPETAPLVLADRPSSGAEECPFPPLR